jgi:DNA polymerase-4
MQFNPSPPTVMHIDLNSCFASVEQQANPRYRGHPLVVAAYTTDRGCILAASREAKRVGIKTGMRVIEGKRLYPRLIVLPSDPPKYRFVNQKLFALLSEYSSLVEVKSIDEMVLKLSDVSNQLSVAKEIKQRIKNEIGEWLTVSIGISTNRYLAKIASNLHKPDGLDMITAQNIEHILCSLTLEELTGIKEGYGERLRRRGILSPLAMYRASSTILSVAFGSKIGYDWWLMLHGWESDLYTRDETKTIGHSYALPKSYLTSDVRLHQILSQLVEKMGNRLRDGHYIAGGIRVSVLFADHTYWNHGEKLVHALFASRDLYYASLTILAKAPKKSVKLLAVSCYFLSDETREQLELFDSSGRKRALTRALDDICNRWGEFTVIPARMLAMEHRVQDRIAFGGVLTGQRDMR